MKNQPAFRVDNHQGQMEAGGRQFAASDEPVSAGRLLAALTRLQEGDCSVRLPLQWAGQMSNLAVAFNAVAERSQRLTRELGQLSRVVGKEGRLDRRMSPGEAGGCWEEAVNSVNSLVEDLAHPTSEMSRVIKAVARGDLSQTMALESGGRRLQGEFLGTARTVNRMVSQLRDFASEVTRVAHEVGVQGRLGGQASVPGTAGTWKDLTHNVNQLAANLTTQVRAIAEVATAVTKGDLTRSISVQARGEVAALKDNLNEMIRNLQATTSKNQEQDWLKTNLARFSNLLQGQRDLAAVGRLVLSELAQVVSVRQAVFYRMDASGKEPCLRLLASYACSGPLPERFRLGEGLIGQCAVDREKIQLAKVKGDFLRIRSGLGSAAPRHVLVLPVLFEGRVMGVMELAALEAFSAAQRALLDPLTEGIGVVLNTIEANRRTEELLEEMLEISDREQRRLGQDLHDDLCQRLAGIEMMSQSLEQKLSTQQRPEWANAAEVTKLIRLAIAHTRDLARGLSPVILESEGLMSALEELAADTQKLFKVACQFEGDATVRISDHTVATHLYRIAQEALANAIRHGRARQVLITLAGANEEGLLEIQDDGVGLPKTAQRSKGMGLRIMRYRAGMVGGALAVQSEASGGTRVRCTFRIPTQPQSQRRRA